MLMTERVVEKYNLFSSAYRNYDFTQLNDSAEIFMHQT